MDLVRDFVRKYINQPVDFDKAFGAECVDLFRQFCADLGFQRTEPVTGAVELYTGYDSRPILKRQFRRFALADIANGDYPRPGDCIVWGKAPTYGHVAICLSADDQLLAVFEQIGYTADDNARSVAERGKYLSAAEMYLNQAHVRVYSGYAGVLGWLRPRNAWVA